MEIPSGLNPLNELAQLKALLAENTQALRAMTVRNPYPSLPKRPSDQLVEPVSPAPAYEEENITGGNQTVNASVDVASATAADCRLWRHVTVWIENVSGTPRPCFVQLRGSRSKATSGGTDIGGRLYLSGREQVAINISDEYWAPWIYAQMYNAHTVAVSLRITILKRR